MAASTSTKEKKSVSMLFVHTVGKNDQGEEEEEKEDDEGETKEQVDLKSNELKLELHVCSEKMEDEQMKY